MKNKIFGLILAVFAFAGFVNAQTTEVKISLDEQFFDALFEAVFTNIGEPSVPISSNKEGEKGDNEEGETTAFVENSTSEVFQNVALKKNPENVCKEAIILKKEVDGVKTAVKFRQGKITAPIAFRGIYNPPLIGCIEFQGWAETNIELTFDQNKKVLVGNAKVVNVNLSGTGGVGSSLLARFVQSSIDQRVNPLEIINMEKLSFTVPVQQAGNLRMKALGMRHVVNDKSLDIILKYQFLKG